MGKLAADAADSALNVSTHVFAAPGAGPWRPFAGEFNASIAGAFTGTLRLEKSYDGGATAVPVAADAYGSPAQFTAPISFLVPEPEPGCLWRWNCTALASGSATARLSR